MVSCFGVLKSNAVCLQLAAQLLDSDFLTVAALHTVAPSVEVRFEHTGLKDEATRGTEVGEGALIVEGDATTLCKRSGRAEGPKTR